MSKYGMDDINGKAVEQLVITSDYTLKGEHHGTVHVESGVFTIMGSLHGTLDIQDYANAIILGSQHGTVTLGYNSSLIIKGSLHGTTILELNSSIIIEENGKLAGTMSNNGKVIVRGVFGGAYSGDGQLIVEGNGEIKKPVIRNGDHYYNL